MTRKILSYLILIVVMISSIVPINAQSTGIFQLTKATLSPNQHYVLEEGTHVISAVVNATGSVSGTGEPPYIEVRVINNADERVVEGVTMVPQKPYLIGNSTQFSILLPTKMIAATYTVEMRAVQNGTLLSKTTATYTVYNDLQKTPTIKSVSINPTSSNEGASGQVNAYVEVSTADMPEGTTLHASLVDSLGKEVTNVYAGTVSGQQATIVISIPAAINAGEYDVKVTALGLVDNSTKYKVMNVAPQKATISSISTSNATLLQGNIEGLVQIVGNNFSTVFSENSVVIYGTDHDFTSLPMPLENVSKTALTFALPKALIAGHYGIKVSTNGQTAVLQEAFIITSNLFAIETLQIQAGANLIAGEVKGTKLIVPKEIERLIEIPASAIPAINSSDKTLIILNSELISKYINQSTSANDPSFFSVNIPERLGMKQEILLEEATILQLAEQDIGLKLSIGSLSVRLPEALMNHGKGLPLKLVVSPVSDTQEENLLYLTKKMATSKMIASSEMIDLQLIRIQGTDEEKMNFEDYNIHLEFAISEEILATVDERKLGIYTLDEDTMLWQYVGGTYNPEEKTIYTNVSHFSKFVVMEKIKSFDDVKADFWGRDVIEVLAAKNIVNGVEDHRFLPNQKMTRAEFVTIMVRALGLETTAYEGAFTDVKASSWYAKYVEAGKSAGIMLGKGNGLFAPLEPISRQEVAIILTRVYKNVKGITGTITDTSGAPYKDLSTSASWAKTAIVEARHYNLMSGGGNQLFLPLSFSTRAENATGLYNLLKAIGLLN